MGEEGRGKDRGRDAVEKASAPARTIDREAGRGLGYVLIGAIRMVYLAAVGILHHKAQPVMGLERVLQALQGEERGDTEETHRCTVTFSMHTIYVYKHE